MRCDRLRTAGHCRPWCGHHRQHPSLPHLVSHGKKMTGTESHAGCSSARASSHNRSQPCIIPLFMILPCLAKTIDRLAVPVASMRAYAAGVDVNYQRVREMETTSTGFRAHQPQQAPVLTRWRPSPRFFILAFGIPQLKVVCFLLLDSAWTVATYTPPPLLLKRMVAPLPFPPQPCIQPAIHLLRARSEDQVSLLPDRCCRPRRPRCSRDSSSPRRGLNNSPRIAPRFVWIRRQRGALVSLRGRILVLLDRPAGHILTEITFKPLSSGHRCAQH
jgi:hypothetical protein